MNRPKSKKTRSKRLVEKIILMQIINFLFFSPLMAVLSESVFSNKSIHKIELMPYAINWTKNLGLREP